MKRVNDAPYVRLGGRAARAMVVGLAALVVLGVVDISMSYVTPELQGPLSRIGSMTAFKSSIADAATPISTSLQGRVMVGYQGWFAFPGLPTGWTAYSHWSRNNVAPTNTNLVVDMWPDLTGFSSGELRAVNLTQNGAPANVYNSAHASTINRHVQWMSTYNIDGAFLQRFVVTLATSSRALPDAVIANFKASAEQYNRTFAVMYDLSGAQESQIISAIQTDWRRLVDQGYTASKSYQVHKGLPIVGMWGVGYANRPLSPQTVATLIRWFKYDAPPQYRATVLLGVDTAWRTGTGDAGPFAAWEPVYVAADVISPWSVGRLVNENQIVSYYENTVAPDKSYLAARNIDLLPVIYPGFSWRNLTGSQSNVIARRGGNLLWWQVREAKRQGITMLYGAMFDEIDEGTALYKVVAKTSDLPINANLIALDVDGYPLPSDWYLQIMKKAKAVIGGQTWTPLSIPRPNTIPGFVENLYRNVLDRASDPVGKQGHVAYLEANRTVAACRGLMTAFYASGEFQARTITDREFVASLYRAVFGREPDEGGLTAWSNQITNGALTRAQVRDTFIMHGEAAAFCTGALSI